jgi:hypothetical protein
VESIRLQGSEGHAFSVADSAAHLDHKPRRNVGRQIGKILDRCDNPSSSIANHEIVKRGDKARDGSRVLVHHEPNVRLIRPDSPEHDRSRRFRALGRDFPDKWGAALQVKHDGLNHTEMDDDERGGRNAHAQHGGTNASRGSQDGPGDRGEAEHRHRHDQPVRIQGRRKPGPQSKRRYGAKE